jgi:hypothetical protein
MAFNLTSHSDITDLPSKKHVEPLPPYRQVEQVTYIDIMIYTHPPWNIDLDG